MHTGWYVQVNNLDTMLLNDVLILNTKNIWILLCKQHFNANVLIMIVYSFISGD